MYRIIRVMSDGDTGKETVAVVENLYAALEKAVNDAGADGWQPIGGHQHQMRVHPWGVRHMASQAMVKEEIHEPKSIHPMELEPLPKNPTGNYEQLSETKSPLLPDSQRETTTTTIPKKGKK